MEWNACNKQKIRMHTHVYLWKKKQSPQWWFASGSGVGRVLGIHQMKTEENAQGQFFQANVYEQLRGEQHKSINLTGEDALLYKSSKKLQTNVQDKK